MERKGMRSRRGAGMFVRADMIVGAIILVVTWVTRATAAHTFVTWDEPAWVYRSVHFLAALGRGDWAQTLLVGHPGVVTMWLGAMGLAWNRFVVPTVAASDWQAIAALATLNVHDETTIRHLAALLPAAMTFLPLAHTLLAGVLWLLLRKILDRPYALAAISLVILDPYGLALSRVLHIDALTSQFMLIACLAALVYTPSLDLPAQVLTAVGCSRLRLRIGARRYLLVSGVAMGLAALTKSYGVLVGPVATLFWLVGWWRRALPHSKLEGDMDAQPPALSSVSLRKAILSWGRDVVLCAVVAGTVFVLAWPAMWVTPLGVLRNMLGLSFEYATRPGDATTAFFRGQVVADPGPWFYLVALWFRATPLALLGGVLAIVGLLWRNRAPTTPGTPNHGALEERNGSGDSEPRGGFALDGRSTKVALGLLVYALLFLIVITLSRKKFDRYMLPALLAGDVLAGIGLAHAVRSLWSIGRAGRTGRHVAVAVTSIALVVVQAVVLLAPIFPSYYLAYYNPLAGGIRRAVQTIPVGWGEGMEQTAPYLAAQGGAADTHVATWAVAGVAPFFPGHVTKPDAQGLVGADYVALYVGDEQVSSPLADGLGEPVFVAHVNGIAYAWVYRNDYDREIARSIDGVADPGAVLVSNVASSLQRHRSSALPYHVISGESEDQVAQALQSAAGDAPYLFYLEFAGAQERALPIIERQLAQGALLLWRKPVAYGTLSYYRRPDGARFVSVPADRPAEGFFAEQLRLQGYGLSAGPLQYRQQAGLALSWRAAGTPEQDYHIFLHLVDGDGRVWGRRDQPLQDDAARLSSLWGDGQDHLCRYTVPIDAGIPPGEYWISIGLYRLADLSRLEIVGNDGRSLGTELRLGPLQVITPLEPPNVEELSIPHPLTAPLGQVAELLGYELSQRTYQSGESLPLTLYWRCIASMSGNYKLALQLLQDGSIVATGQADPAGAGYPTERWVPGQILRYPHRLLIPGNTASGDYDLALNWIDARGERLLAQDLVLARIPVEHRDRLFSPPPMQHPLDIQVGETAELLGYDIANTAARPGEALQLTLYWRALEPSAISYTVFTHLLDAGGVVRGQSDSVPARGQRPMTGWVEGEIIVDPYEMTVAPDAVPGPHRIEVGVYDPANGQRLPLAAPDGTSLPDRRLLIDETIQVE